MTKFIIIFIVLMNIFTTPCFTEDLCLLYCTAPFGVNYEIKFLMQYMIDEYGFVLDEFGNTPYLNIIDFVDDSVTIEYFPRGLASLNDQSLPPRLYRRIKRNDYFLILLEDIAQKLSEEGIHISKIKELRIKICDYLYEINLNKDIVLIGVTENYPSRVISSNYIVMKIDINKSVLVFDRIDNK